MAAQQNDIARYYTRFGSWAGYNLVMSRSQHAGYWLEDTNSERTAQRNYLELLASLLKLETSDNVLDAGSVQGYAARYLAQTTGARLTGITITPREVRISDKLSRRVKNRPHFVLGDYANSEFLDNYFDVLYTTETLSHAGDMQRTMQEFFRVLKPGGRIVLMDYEVRTKGLTNDKKQVLDFLYQYAGGYGLYQQNPGEVAAALKSAGFDTITESDISAYTKPTYDRLRRIARPFAWIRPSSRLAPYFVNAVMATYFYSSWYEDGTFRYMVYQARKPGSKHV